MDTQTMMMLFLALILVLAVYEISTLRKKIICRYTSRSKQTYEKLVKAESTHVVFEGKKFYIISECVTHRWYKKGMMAFLGMFMPELSFYWNSPYPVDPNTQQPVMLSPEVERAIDQSEVLKDYAGSQQRAISGTARMTGLQKWLPYIMIGALLIGAYFIYTMKTDQDIIKQAISDIFIKIGY